MKKFRRLGIVLFSLLISFVMGTTMAFAGITPAKAKELALKDAGLTASQICKLAIEKEDKGSCEVEFVQRSTGTKYEYEFSKSGKMTEREISYVCKAVKSRKKIGKKKARKIAAKATGVKYSKVKKGCVRYTLKKGVGKYKIKFRKGKRSYKLVLLAKTGQIIQYEVKIRK